jgi:hypothetical protein
MSIWTQDISIWDQVIEEIKHPDTVFVSQELYNKMILHRSFLHTGSYELQEGSVGRLLGMKVFLNRELSDDECIIVPNSRELERTIKELCGF